MSDAWTGGDAYESFIGRWSRPVATAFVDWLGVAPGGRWCDIGCGTGALTSTVLARAEPAEVVGVDPSEAYIIHATATVADRRARFEVGTMPPVDGLDAAVSGLALNFVPDPAATAGAMAAATRPGGVVAVYVWDYSDGMQLLRQFWDAAVALDPEAAELDEGPRFAHVCNPDALAALFAGLDAVETQAIDVETPFADFDDYWTPFLSGQGPAPGYVATLSEDRRAALRDRLASMPLPTRARAWAFRGRRP